MRALSSYVLRLNLMPLTVTSNISANWMNGKPSEAG